MALWGSFAFKPAQLFIPVLFQSGSPGLHTANHSGEHVHRLRPCLTGKCSECLREGSAVCCSGSYSGVFIWAHVRRQAAAGHDAGRHWPRARNKWPPPLKTRWKSLLKVMHFCLLSQWIPFGLMRLEGLEQFISRKCSVEISQRIPLDDQSAARSQTSVKCRWSEGQPLPFPCVSGAFSLSLSSIDWLSP